MKVKVYSTNSCPWCVKAKNYLKMNNIDYTEVNVNEDKEAAMEMIEKSKQTGVPVLEIGNEIVVGFDKRRIDSLLNL